MDLNLKELENKFYLEILSGKYWITNIKSSNFIY